MIVEGQRSDCITILNDLIAINTANPPGNEKPAAEYLAGILEPYGFRCLVQDLGENRANLIAEIGKKDGPELLFQGHLDVVPAIGRWKTDPFQAILREERIYGRGTADMKGGIAAMCEAAIRVAREGGPKRGRLKLLFVADEECSNLGTLNYLKQYGAKGYAVIGEPTELQIAIAHRGVSRDYIDLLGEQRHAALPAVSEDAVTEAAKAVMAVHEIGKTLEKYRHQVLPPPSIAVTMVQGYEKDNVVPGRVRLLLDFRTLPGMSHEEVGKILDDGLRQAGIKNYTRSPHFYMPGGEISLQDEFVKLCERAREKALEQMEDKSQLEKFGSPCAFNASCEQCFLVGHGVKAVICGPGSIAQAHTVGEYTSEKQVRTAVVLYEEIVKLLLGQK